MYIKYFLAGTILLSAVAFSCDKSQSTTESAENKPTVINSPRVNQEGFVKISVDELVKAYSENKELANSLYLGKRMIITGIVGSINNEDEKNPVVTFKTNKNSLQIICHVRPKQKRMDTLKENQEVSIGGRSAESAGNLIINDAAIIKNNN